MKIEAPNKSIWTTPDIGVAATIICLNQYELIGLDKANPRRVLFQFDYDSNLEKLASEYWSRDIQVDARTLVESLKQLKGQLYAG